MNSLRSKITKRRKMESKSGNWQPVTMEVEVELVCLLRYYHNVILKKYINYVIVSEQKLLRVITYS